jgi:hypothetical protein
MHERCYKRWNVAVAVGRLLVSLCIKRNYNNKRYQTGALVQSNPFIKALCRTESNCETNLTRDCSEQVFELVFICISLFFSCEICLRNKRRVPEL